MFYTYGQNNSGGYIITNEEFGVGETLVIEADSAREADNKLHEIGDNVDNFWNYCECCGERWCEKFWYGEGEAGDEVPSEYGTPLTEQVNSYCDVVYFVHYKDGSFKKFINKKEEK